MIALHKHVTSAETTVAPVLRIADKQPRLSATHRAYQEHNNVQVRNSSPTCQLSVAHSMPRTQAHSLLLPNVEQQLRLHLCVTAVVCKMLVSPCYSCRIYLHSVICTGVNNSAISSQSQGSCAHGNSSTSSSKSKSSGNNGDVYRGHMSHTGTRNSHSTDAHYEYEADDSNDGDGDNYDDASEASVCTKNTRQQHSNSSVKANNGSSSNSSSSAAKRAAKYTTTAQQSNIDRIDSSSSSDEAANKETSSSDDDSDADSTGVSRRGNTKKAGTHTVHLLLHTENCVVISVLVTTYCREALLPWKYCIVS
jgi:hypothetical protein